MCSSLNFGLPNFGYAADFGLPRRFLGHNNFNSYGANFNYGSSYGFPDRLYGINSGPYLAGPYSQGEAVATLCAGRGAWCDAVSIAGVPVRAPLDARCNPVANIQDRLYLDAGLSGPANSFLFSGVGNRVAVTNGSCQISPIGSDTLRFTASFNGL